MIRISLDRDELSNEYNKAKEILLDYLNKKGIIKDDLTKELKQEISFVLVEKGMLLDQLLIRFFSKMIQKHVK